MRGGVALIDADVICYVACAVSTVEFDFGDGEDTTLANIRMAKEVADEKVAEWTEAAGCKRRVLVFSDRRAPKTSFRYHIHPHYKAQRPDSKPVLHDAIVEYLKDTYTYLDLPGLEGDDTLGILATGPDGKKYTIVSIDKDMLTIPARIVNPGRGDDDPEIHTITPFQADYHWMTQVICGDTVDNYKGAPGAGPKKALEVLAGARTTHEMWERVLHVFANQFDHARWGKNFVHANAYDEALMNARCARILRDGEYDRRKTLVQLWGPTEEEKTWISPY